MNASCLWKSSQAVLSPACPAACLCAGLQLTKHQQQSRAQQEAFMQLAEKHSVPSPLGLSTPSLPLPLKRITDRWRAAKSFYLLRWNVALTIYTGVSTSLCLSLRTVSWEFLSDCQPQHWTSSHGPPDLFGS
ncbi:unnamed protein product [Pleuronectes platessa]|uniref:Uncharacterized protein n=1 Tax=Pleuronectes platessa TaxID=8262 RepID=A0A9N7UB41_PLEPL|nr:unnamed protein product [Pleuronectes platessa]